MPKNYADFWNSIQKDAIHLLVDRARELHKYLSDPYSPGTQPIRDSEMPVAWANMTPEQRMNLMVNQPDEYARLKKVVEKVRDGGSNRR